jgi:Protein of unknown function (DUF3500)
MISRVRTQVAGALAIAALVSFAALARAEGAADLTAAVADWLASLPEDLRDAADYASDDDERFDLRLAPIGLEGLRRDAMSDAQWQGWLGALGTALSMRGLQKVESIMANEREVRARDRETWIGTWFGGFVHGEGRYFASVYGDPGQGTPWGLRFDGHHVSLNWTVPRASSISVTPLFLGGEPREIPADHERGGLRVLADEEDRGLALWNALRHEQRNAARIQFEPASGIAATNRPLFLGEGPHVARPAPRGIARADLDPAQQALLDALVATYYANFSEAIAAERLAAIDAAGRDAIHFAWAGSLQPGEPGYYRVQGPNFLIEFDNTAPAADHVHAILREFDGDYGRDLLAEHYAREHERAIASGR